jgi:hypothetical protein
MLPVHHGFEWRGVLIMILPPGFAATEFDDDRIITGANSNDRRHGGRFDYIIRISAGRNRVLPCCSLHITVCTKKTECEITAPSGGDNATHMLQQTYNVKSSLKKIFFYKTLNQPLSDDRFFNL